MKRLLLSFFLLGVLGILPSKAYADCQQVYGGAINCVSYNFSVQKFVETPGTNNFVNNLSVSNPTFSANQNVLFKIVITNTGTQNIPTLTVVDTLPQFLTFVSGPGTYNSNNNTLTFVINNLNAGQSQTINITAKVTTLNNLPAGETCVVNQAVATDSNGMSNNATSQLCIQTPTVLPVVKAKVTPPTGPETLPLALLLPGALGGLFLRRKSQKSIIEGGEK